MRLRWIPPLALICAACAAPDAAAPPAAPADASAPAPPPAPADPAPAGPPRLTAQGWGPLRIGATRAQVVAAAGEDAHPGAVGGPEPEACDEFHPLDAPEGLRVMVERGRLTRVSLADPAEVETDAGIGVGDAAGEVEAAYGARVGSSPHKYWPAPARYLTAWTHEASDSTARGIVYEIDADGRVAQIHAGAASIRYVEGCS